jgi:hypothetical protein
MKLLGARAGGDKARMGRVRLALVWLDGQL